jgi:hypothetical protein
MQPANKFEYQRARLRNPSRKPPALVNDAGVSQRLVEFRRRSYSTRSPLFRRPPYSGTTQTANSARDSIKPGERRRPSAHKPALARGSRRQCRFRYRCLLPQGQGRTLGSERIVTGIRLSWLLLGNRDGGFQGCVSCQPERPQSGGLFPRGRKRYLVFGHCLLSLSQLLFLFLESRFGAVTRLFNVRVQCRYSFRANPLARQTFLPEKRMRAAKWGCSTEPTPFQVICSGAPKPAGVPVLPIRIDRHLRDSVSSTPPLPCVDCFAAEAARKNIASA